MTLHNAKGLEFDAVFVIGMEQNLFPHARSIEEANIEEERRLCYVAITRARRELSLVYARQRTLFGARGYNAPSQFIAEIPENLIERERRPAAFGSASRGGSGWQPSERRRDDAAPGHRAARRAPADLGRRQRRARPARRGRRHRHGRRRPGDRPLPLRRLRAPPAPGLRTAQAHLTRRGLPAQRRWYHPPRGAISSVGRAPARQAGGHWFEPSIAHPGTSAKELHIESICDLLEQRPIRLRPLKTARGGSDCPSSVPQRSSRRLIFARRGRTSKRRQVDDVSPT